jgi:hydroxypyruvate isomerase
MITYVSLSLMEGSAQCLEQRRHSPPKCLTSCSKPWLQTRLVSLNSTENTWHTLDLLREAAPHRIEEVRQRAHYLRSSSLVLGARKVARLAGTLEEKARTSVSADNDALEPIAEALREVQTELAERLGNGVIPADKTAAY